MDMTPRFVPLMRELKKGSSQTRMLLQYRHFRKFEYETIQPNCQYASTLSMSLRVCSLDWRDRWLSC